MPAPCKCADGICLAPAVHLQRIVCRRAAKTVALGFFIGIRSGARIRQPCTSTRNELETKRIGMPVTAVTPTVRSSIDNHDGVCGRHRIISANYKCLGAGLSRSCGQLVIYPNSCSAQQPHRLFAHFPGNSFPITSSVEDGGVASGSVMCSGRLRRPSNKRPPSSSPNRGACPAALIVASASAMCFSVRSYDSGMTMSFRSARMRA